MVRTYAYRRPRIRLVDVDDWDVIRRPIVVTECPSHSPTPPRIYSPGRLDLNIPTVPASDYRREYHYETTSSVPGRSYEHKYESSRTFPDYRATGYTSPTYTSPSYSTYPRTTYQSTVTRIGPYGVTTRTYRY